MSRVIAPLQAVEAPARSIRRLIVAGPAWLALAGAVVSLALAGCALAPPGPERGTSFALPQSEQGALHRYGSAIDAELADGESAFWLLDRADLALDARLALVDEAVSSLDIQYFIWEKDATSGLFSRRVLHAADRGTRVRILLDDLTLTGQDDKFAALAKHPNIEVRSFNPFRRRGKIARFAEFAFRWGALNHRMHNKTIIADNHFAITGGRNIGDRYFGVYETFVQNDLDVLTVGPIVADVSASFDLYWNSSESYPLEDVISRRSERALLDETSHWFEGVYFSEREKLDAFPLEPIDWSDFFDGLGRTFVTGAGNLEQDLPAVDEELPTQLYQPLSDFVAQARQKLVISSPYFVPDEPFLELIEGLAASGVRVIVLTNSLASNNHMIAHSAYKHWRKRLLRSGIELHEARADSMAIDFYQTPPTEAAFLGLHSKAVVVDDRWSYIGSANIDPRSLIINTEIGFFIDSPELAARLMALIERDLKPENAWQVELDERGKLRWTSSRGTVRRQPALGFKQRVAEFFINLLPFKNQA